MHLAPLQALYNVAHYCSGIQLLRYSIMKGSYTLPDQLPAETKEKKIEEQ